MSYKILRIETDFDFHPCRLPPDYDKPYRHRMRGRNDKAQKKRFVESLLKVSFTMSVIFPAISGRSLLFQTFTVRWYSNRLSAETD